MKRKITQEEFDEALMLHRKWRLNIEGGVRMDFKSCDLSGIAFHCANLSLAILRYADLRGANLEHTTLTNANLYSADLRGARLQGSCLCSANLHSADMRDTDLFGCCLYFADLRHTNFSNATIRDEATLICSNPICTIGPIGSRNDYLVFFTTDKGVYLQTGCFFGTVKEFLNSVKDTHGTNAYAQEYRQVAKLAKLHAQLWAEEQANA